MFTLREAYGTESEMFEAISQQSAKGFDTLCEVVHVLAEQGELTRRYEGFEAQEILTSEQISFLASPMDTVNLRNTVLKAVMKGFGREIEEEEKDLGLAELGQKKTTKLQKRNTSR